MTRQLQQGFSRLSTLAEVSRTLNQPRKLISMNTLQRMMRQPLNGPKATPTVTEKSSMPAPRSSHSASPANSVADVALCVGGSVSAISEYETAKSMCVAYGKSYETFACNDTIPLLPDHLDNAVTLHPDKFNNAPQGWRARRIAAGLNDAPRRWAHRDYVGFTDSCKDWQGSSGLIMVKIARELRHTHIILCGVPMTVEDGHITRGARWQAAHGFRRGWLARIPRLKPFVRSMSGWTQEQFGFPTGEWLKTTITDEHPQGREPGQPIRA